MTANEDVRTMAVDHRAHIQGIMSRITTDMSHHDFQSFTIEKLHQRTFKPDFLRITVAIDPYQGLESGDGMNEIDTSSEIARMPYHIYRREEILELIAEHSMGI